MDISVGSGGKRSHEFIKDVVLRYFDSPELKELPDSASLDIGGSRIAFTTDCYVIKPIFFPGGDLGKLAVSGTVNDLVVSGARPLYISFSMIIEEGLELEVLERILMSASKTAELSGVRIVTGDTKVVHRNEADGVYVNTSGMGEIVYQNRHRPGPGDLILVSGCVGDHGVSVMVARGEFDFEGAVKSDVRPLIELLDLWRKGLVKWMRDITRGGLSTIVHELAEQSGLTAILSEEAIPLSDQVRAVADILGIDPLYLPSEGCAAMVVSEKDADRAIEVMREQGFDRASIVGELVEKRSGFNLLLRTRSGGTRIMEPLTSELLPRIC